MRASFYTRLSAVVGGNLHDVFNAASLTAQISGSATPQAQAALMVFKMCADACYCGHALSDAIGLDGKATALLTDSKGFKDFGKKICSLTLSVGDTASDGALAATFLNGQKILEISATRLALVSEWGSRLYVISGGKRALSSFYKLTCSLFNPEKADIRAMLLARTVKNVAILALTAFGISYVCAIYTVAPATLLALNVAAAAGSLLSKKINLVDDENQIVRRSWLIA